MEKADIISILRSNKTVFSFKDILLSSGENNPALLRRRIHYYITHGQLYGICRGLYAKDKSYNKLELATKIFSPAYISFETVLAEAGIIFQSYGQIFVASYQTKEIACDGHNYSFKKIKDAILTNNTGVEDRNNYSIAIKERAFLDVVYLNKEYHFDNLSPLDWNKVFELLPIYNNKRMTKIVKKYYEAFKADNQ
jgi:predicted transcriptional regulator of viral defense system